MCCIKVHKAASRDGNTLRVTGRRRWTRVLYDRGHLKEIGVAIEVSVAYKSRGRVADRKGIVTIKGQQLAKQSSRSDGE